MASENKPHDEFADNDPLDGSVGSAGSVGESVVGTIGSSEFIQESTAIPESGYVEIQESNGEGPLVVGDGDAIPESQAVAADAAGTAAAEKPKTAGGKKNLPLFIAGGVAAAVIAGVIGMKAMSGGDQATQVAPVKSAAPASAAAPAKPPVKASDVASAAAVTASGASAPNASASAVEPAIPASSAIAPLVIAPVAASASQLAVVASPAKAVDPVKAPEPAKTPEPVKAPEIVKQVAPALPAVAQPPVKAAPVAAPAVAAPAPACIDDRSKTKPVAKVVKKGPAPFKLVEPKPVKVKKVPQPLPSTEGYVVHMGINGLAWVTLPSGDQVTAAVGDTIPGLGVVKSVDMKAHSVRVGRVTLK